MVSVGDSCTVRGTIIPIATMIFEGYPMPTDGIITSWCMYCAMGSGNAKLKVFRDGGTDWIFVGESNPTSVSAGLNSGLVANIAVQSGDLLGIYWDTNYLFNYDGGGPANAHFRSGVDVTKTKPKSYYHSTTNVAQISLQAQLQVTNTPANITATSITGTPSDPCIFGSCAVDVSVTWTNSGEATGTIVPNITIDGIAATPIPPSENMIGGAILVKTFTVSDLTAGPHDICPSPN